MTDGIINHLNNIQYNLQNLSQLPVADKSGTLNRSAVSQVRNEKENKINPQDRKQEKRAASKPNKKKATSITPSELISNLVATQEVEEANSQKPDPKNATAFKELKEKTHLVNESS